MTLEERKQRLIEQAQKRLETSANSGTDNYNNTEKKEYPKKNWYGIRNNEIAVFHPVGNLMQERRHGWETKLIMYSTIRDDEGKKLNIVWPYKTDEFGAPRLGNSNKVLLDDDFILYKVWQALSAGMTNQDKFKTARPTEGDFANTDIFKWVFWNKTQAEMDGEAKAIQSKKISGPINNPWLGQERILMPVWVPGDKWCIENNHTRLLTTNMKLTPSQDGTKEYDNSDIGISMSLYDHLIVKVAAENDGHLDTDIAIQYHANRSFNEKYEIQRVTDSVVVKNVKKITGLDVSSAPLDPDFVDKLNHHDLDDPDYFFNVTPNLVIFKRCGNKIKEVDVEVNKKHGNSNSNLYGELEEKAEIEREEFKKKYADETKTVSPVTDNPIADSAKETPVEKPSRPTRGTSHEPESKKELTLEEQCAKVYPHWDKLSQEEKELQMSGISGFENGYPVFGPETIETFPACECKFENGEQVATHENLSHCPNCGIKFP